MQALKTIDPQLPKDNLSLTNRSGPQLDADSVMALGKLMMQAQARHPNQVLAVGTADMYLVEWEEMALKYGMETFRDGLSKAIRGEFFPSPETIRAHVQAIAKERREQREMAQAKAEHEAISADAKAHPEKYTTINQLVAEYREKRKA